MDTIIKKLKKFKKINTKKVYYFDLIVIVTILSILLVFLYTKLSKKTTWIDARILISNKDWWWTAEPPTYWLVDDLGTGMISYSSFGEKMAEIIDVDIISIGGPSKQAYVDVSLKVSYDSKRDLYLFNYQPLQKGKPIDLTFGKMNVGGIVTEIGEDKNERVYKKLQVRVSHLEPWLSPQFKVGLEMRDSKQRVLVTVDSVKTQVSTLIPVVKLKDEYFADTGDFYDVIMDVTISATRDVDGVYRFIDGTPLKPGNEVWFHFPEVVARSKIMNIIE